MDEQDGEDAGVAEDPSDLGVNTVLSPEEEAEPKTTEQSKGAQERVPTKIVRAQKALESGRKIRILEKSLSETLVYEPDQLAPKPKSPDTNSIRMIVGLSVAVLVLGGLFVWSSQQTEESATRMELDATPIVLPPRPARSPPKEAQVPNERPVLRPVRMIRGLKGIPENSPRKSKKLKRKRVKKKSSAKSSSAPSQTILEDAPRSPAENSAEKPNRVEKKELDELPAAEESKAFGVLQLKGPPQTMIQIDQAKIGALPLPELGLPPGLHSVWAELPGHETSLMQVKIVAGESTTLTLKLDPIPKAKLPDGQ